MSLKKSIQKESPIGSIVFRQKAKVKILDSEVSNSSMPLVSVLVPIYNTGYYLGRCIESIISQSYRNLQIVLLNDGSTDNCKDICQKYSNLDKRIEYHVQLNCGIAASRNKLIFLASGQYSIFVDSDDWINADMI